MKPIDNIIRCDLCHKQLTVTASSLEEKDLTLMKSDEQVSEELAKTGSAKATHAVRVTFLTCPHCGKQYPVVLDDAQTLELLEISRDLYQRRMRWVTRGKAVPDNLQKKFEKARLKLSISRQKLAEEYGQSFYQLEDGTVVQLEYRYRER